MVFTLGMSEEFPVWRQQDGSLHASGAMRSSRIWLLDNQEAVEADRLSSISGLLSQARLTSTREQRQQPPGQWRQPPESSPTQGHAPQGGSLFQTGTGKSVQVSSASMKRALALLGEEGTDAHSTPMFKRANAGSEQTLFQTATGKSVPVSASAMSKARALLQERHAETPRSKPRTPASSFTNAGSSLRKFPASVPPFKQPRRRFTSPLTPVPRVHHQEQAEEVTSAASPSLAELKFRLWTPIARELSITPRDKEFRMPVRVNLRQFFQHAPHPSKEELRLVAAEVKSLTADNALDYKFDVGHGAQKVGAVELRNMLLEAGAKPHLATPEWVDNHYRWIVWKLASQQRSYPGRAGGFLTLNNVFVELKYRYLREVGFGHRSIIRKICEKDALAGETMVLCISAIKRWPTYNENGELSETARVEVTDGWYCLNAILDVPLTKQLQAGNLFIGQKLQITEAQIYGAEGGLPPLEAYGVFSLALHMNGTYRAHWADKLGTCKRRSLPLAFKCIKADGGLVPSVYVGITRIYPLLYKERLQIGMSITRNARSEQVAQMIYEQSREGVIEGVMTNIQQEESVENEELLEEGARIFKTLECASDPELIMADMTTKDHAILCAYQEKEKSRRQDAAEKLVQKALKDAQLLSRNVTRFFKVSVTGLQQGGSSRSKSGFITVWDPSDELIEDLVEGASYLVSSLKTGPVSKTSELRLSASKSTKWRKLSGQQFKFQYKPRSGTPLSSLLQLPAYSEFDVAAYVLHVGDVYTSGDRKRQWIFVSDGSLQHGQAALLAIDFAAPSNAFSPFESAYSGTVVGFCNLVKAHPDKKNCMWIAEATNTTIYSSKLSTKAFLHLCKPAALVTRWSKASPQLVACLQHRVLEILADDT